MALPTEERDWLRLPDEILTSILQYLVNLQDYIRFSIVCKQWHSVAKAEKQNHIATRDQIPFLLVPTKDLDQWSLYNVAQDRILNTKLRVRIPDGNRIHGSSHGWLILAGNANEIIAITLFNPFTQAQISLPPITYHKETPWFVNKVSLSLDPSLHPNDFKVVAFIYEDSHFFLALIQPAISRDWWTLRGSFWWFCPYRMPMMCDIMFDRSGKWVYANMSYNSMLVRADLDGEVLETVDKPWSADGGESLGKVSSGGELLMFTGPYSDEVQGWKLQGSSFVEVNDLVGDTAAFIGERSSTTVVGQGFQGVDTDCIYYHSGSFHIRKFNLKNGKVEDLDVLKGSPSDCGSLLMEKLTCLTNLSHQFVSPLTKLSHKKT
ncbi:hypothetical protein LINGRAHAP2_LOCUS9504 [Linum grandiflorum]